MYILQSKKFIRAKLFTVFGGVMALLKNSNTTAEFDKKDEPVFFEICVSCGTIHRIYIDNKDLKKWTQKNIL